MKNLYQICGELTRIFLRRRDKSLAGIALIDTADLEKVNSFSGSWFVQDRHAREGTQYVRGSYAYGGPLLHRFLLSVTDRAVQVDHDDQDGLNNRRSNLIRTNNSGNCLNRPVQINNISGASGVSWNRKTKKWTVRIGSGTAGKRIFLGYFDTKDQAIAAVNAARLERIREERDAVKAA